MYKKAVAVVYLILGVIGFALYSCVILLYSLFRNCNFLYRGRSWGKWF